MDATPQDFGNTSWLRKHAIVRGHELQSAAGSEAAALRHTNPQRIREERCMKRLVSILVAGGLSLLGSSISTQSNA
jgi:hypothetical protein